MTTRQQVEELRALLDQVIPGDVLDVSVPDKSWGPEEDKKADSILGTIKYLREEGNECENYIINDTQHCLPKAAKHQIVKYIREDDVGCRVKFMKGVNNAHKT